MLAKNADTVDGPRTGQRRHDLPCEPVLVFYDGHCASCHFVVRFLLQRSRRQRFRFIALQDLVGKPLQNTIKHQLQLDLGSSLIVWKNGELFSRAAAVLAIFSELSGFWKTFLLARLLPLSLSNFFYDLYARHRYHILGRAKNPDICSILPPDQRALFPRNGLTGLLVFPPGKKVFLSAQWRNLVLINYRVPAAALQEFIPHGVELDDWQGETLMSLVAFSFAGTSVMGMTLPIWSDFEEVNLRFYVKRRIPFQGEWIWQRGVVFIREIVPSNLIAQTANIFYGERYAAHRMDHQLKTGSVDYSWTDAKGECRIRVNFEGAPEDLQDGSLAEFLTEHYYGFARKGPTRTLSYQVEHPRWRTWNEVQVHIQGDFARFYPQALRPYLQAPHSTVLAEGSPVRVMQGQRL